MRPLYIFAKIAKNPDGRVDLHSSVRTDVKSGSRKNPTNFWYRVINVDWKMDKKSIGFTIYSGDVIERTVLQSSK